MTLTPRLRKFALTAHVAFSVAWLGAVAGFLSLAVAGLTSESAQMVRAAYLAMELTAWFVILPLSLASLLSGLDLICVGLIEDAGRDRRSHFDKLCPNGSGTFAGLSGRAAELVESGWNSANDGRGALLSLEQS